MKNSKKYSRIVPIILSVSLLTLANVGVVRATTPANPPAGSSFDQRLAQRKTEQNVQLSTNDQQHITSTCTRIQSTIRKLQTSATTVANNRNGTYQKIDGLALISIGQLKLASLDTFALEQDRTTLAQKMAAFQTTANNYQQTLGDLLVINCQADPVGFQALLNTARAYYTQLSSESNDISAYITNTFQPALQNFITQLQPKSNVGGQQ